MPIHKDIVADGSAFDGTAGKGLFSITQTGGRSIQPALNSVSFKTAGSAVAFALYKQDPNIAGNKIKVLGGTDTEFTIEGRSLILPVEDSGQAWPLLLETGNMSGGDGWLTVDYDFAPTEG